MERLLDIKEAAGILNVSEMTVRRWTNAGSLHCYRVGGKRERRFRRQDLQDYLDRRAMKAKATLNVPLGCGTWAVQDGSHGLHLSLDGDEALQCATSYVLEGITQGETVLLVAAPEDRERLLGELRKRGSEPESHLKRGTLRLSVGQDTPSGQAQYIAEIAAGSPGRLRVFGDMSWTKRKGWRLERLRQLEEMAGAVSGKPGMLLLCQYPLAEFSGAAALMTLETHDYVIYRGALLECPWGRKEMTASS